MTIDELMEKAIKNLEKGSDDDSCMIEEFTIDIDRFLDNQREAHKWIGIVNLVSMHTKKTICGLIDWEQRIYV